MAKDIRLSLDFMMHPKTIKLRKKLGEPGVLALICLWLYAGRHRTKGILTNMDDDDFAIACCYEGDPVELRNTLIEYGFIERNGDNELHIHDWKDYQGYVFYAEERSQQAKEAAASRWQRLKNKGEMRTACAPHTISNAPSPIPIPNPSPNPNPTDGKKRKKVAASFDAAAIIAEYQNHLAYKMLDVEREYHKCCAYWEVKGKKVTRRIFVNWLNKADVPMESKYL